MSDLSSEPDRHKNEANPADLARLAQAGDDEARERLFREIWPVCQRVARRMSASDEAAADIVQDSIVKALVNLPRFDHRSSFKTWMMRIVANTAMDHLRSNRRRRVLFDITAWRTGGQTGAAEPFRKENPADGLERQDLRQQLDTALAGLSEATRGAFVLYAEAEMTYQEVADSLGIPLGTVMSRIHAARKKLQVAIEKLDGSTPESGQQASRRDAAEQPTEKRLETEYRMTVQAIFNTSTKGAYA